VITAGLVLLQCAAIGSDGFDNVLQERSSFAMPDNTNLVVARTQFY
jgi:hypothetical protein